MGSIHVVGVNTVETISAGVQAILQDIKGRASNVGKAGGMQPEEFQAFMMDYQTRLDMLKKLLDSVEQAVRSFHRP